MQSDDPAFLTVGTEVSAKFKGAFCEAKIKKVTKSVKIKLLNKEQPGSSSFFADHTQIKSDGPLEVNQVVEIHQGKSTIKALIQHIKDCSTYHVVFNDGDEKTLRRTQMCLKGGRHFDEKASLDAMPLYNPEHWINHPDLVKSMEIMPKEMMRKYKRKKDQEEETPTKRKRRKNEAEESDEEGAKKREKRAAASAANVAIEEMDQGDTEVSDETSSGDASDVEKEREKDRKKAEMEKRERSVLRTEAKADKFVPGELVCVYNQPELKGSFAPAIVIARSVYHKQAPKNEKLPRDHIPIRSFGTSQLSRSPAHFLTPYSPSKVTKKLLEKETPTFRSAIEKANAYAEKQTLPPNWKINEIFEEDKPGPSKPREMKKEKKEPKKEDKDKKKEKEKEKEKETESDTSSEEESDEETTAEERDFFVAQLYKFEEERAMPINKAPVLGGKDIDLYRFHRIVQRYGGSKKVNANNDWKKVLVRMKLEGCPGATPVTVKKAYARYLKEFSNFYRTLGIASQSGTTSSPRDRRVLLRGPVEDKKKKKEKKPGEKESTVEKESSVESKDERKDKEKDKKEKSVEKKEAKTEKKEPEVKKESPEKKDESKKEEKKADEKKKNERKKEDSESAETSAEKDKKLLRPTDLKLKKDIKKEEPVAASSQADQASTSGNAKKVTSKEKKSFGPKYGKAPKQPEVTEDYMLADCFTQFHLGQKVNAWHDGRWYDARVINVLFTKAPELIEIISRYEYINTPWLPDELLNRLKGVMQDISVTVHYLGWNSRYDEVVTLSKIKSSVKDQELSMSHFKPGNPYGIHVNQEFLSRVVSWVRSSQGIGSVKKEEGGQGLVVGMGGYRPRRVSVSQYEQLTAAVRNHRHQARISESSSSTVSTTPAPPPVEEIRRQEPRQPETVMPRSEGIPVPVITTSTSSIPAESRILPATIESERRVEPISEPSPIASPRPKRQRTLSTTSNRTASPAVPLATPSPAPTPPTSSNRSISPPKAVSPSKPRTASASEQSSARPSPAKSPEKRAAVEMKEEKKIEPVAEIKEVQKKESAKEVEVPKIAKVASPPVAPLVQSPIPSTPVAKIQSEEEKKGEEIPVEEPTEEEEVDEDEEEINDEEELEEAIEDEEEDDDEVEILIKKEPEPPRRMAFMVKDTAKHLIVDRVETRKHLEEDEDGFDQLEEEAKNVCNLTREDDSDTGSGSATPTRTDEDTGRDDNESPSLPVPGTTKIIKRKKHSRYSNMVVDRKYMKHKPKEKISKDEASAEEEDDDESAFNKESYVKRKNTMYKQLETDNQLDDCSLLNIECISKLAENLSNEEFVAAAEERILLLREVYSQSRQGIHELEKRRKTQEDKKKEEKERLSKDLSSPSTSSTSIET